MTKSEVIVRSAETKDVLRIAEFNIAMAKETENEMLDPKTVAEGVKEVIEDSGKGFYLVAETKDSNQEIVGQVLVTFEWSDWKNKNLWWLQSVYVAPSYRKNKIFSKLFYKLVDLAQIKGNVGGLRLYVVKHNSTAKDVYKSLGFKKTYYEMFERDLPAKRRNAR